MKGEQTIQPPPGAHPIPEHIWARVLAFLAARVNGQVILNVHDGRVLTAEIREQVRKGPDVR